MTSVATDRPLDVWSGVIGQDGAVAQLTAAAVNPVHAYLLVGPAGSGKRMAARAFAALLLAGDSQGEDAEGNTAYSNQTPDGVPAPAGGLPPRNRANGRASCRERVLQYVEILVVAVTLQKKNIHNTPTKKKIQTTND